MDKLPIPEYNEVSIDNIAPGVHGLRVLFVNVFAVTNPQGGWVLIDAAIPMSAGKIRTWLAKHYGENARPLSIIQTHGHFDHTGALKELADEWNVPIYAHTEELPFLTGKSEYPPPDPSAGGGLMTIMSPLFPRGPIDVSNHVRPLQANGDIPDLPGWKWIHTPGHTVGHISLFRASDGVLLVGDAFCTTDQQSFLAVASQKPELHGPPAYYTPDWDKARASVRKLAALRPAVLAPGHGLPMAGAEVEQALQTLATDFDRIAMPDKTQTAR